MTLDPAVRQVVDATPLAHLASVLPDGGPHSVPVWIGTEGEHLVFFTGPDSQKARNLRRDPLVAISMTPPDEPFRPVLVRGRVVAWLDGDAAWAIVDRVSRAYTGGTYPRTHDRVVALVEPEWQRVGVG